MRFCGTFPVCEKLAGAEERVQANADPGERVGAALFTIDDAHRVAHHEPCVPQGRHGLGERAAGRDDVLHQAHELTRADTGPRSDSRCRIPSLHRAR